MAKEDDAIAGVEGVGEAAEGIVNGSEGYDYGLIRIDSSETVVGG